jgi:hypothetical protein
VIFVSSRLSVGIYLVVHILVVGFFVLNFVPLISRAAMGDELPSWTRDQQKVAFATAVTTFIGGAVAIGLGLKPPRDEVDAARPDNKRKPTRSLIGLGDTLTPGITPPDWARVTLAIAYTLAYFFLGLATWLVWWFSDTASPGAPPFPALLSDFKNAWVGLFFGSVLSAYRDPDDYDRGRNGEAPEAQQQGQE